MTIREIQQQVIKFNKQAEAFNIPNRVRLDVVIGDYRPEHYTVADYKSFKKELYSEYITPVADAIIKCNDFEPNSDLVKLNIWAGWLGNITETVYTEIVSYIEEV